MLKGNSKYDLLLRRQALVLVVVAHPVVRDRLQFFLRSPLGIQPSIDILRLDWYWASVMAGRSDISWRFVSDSGKAIKIRLSGFLPMGRLSENTRLRRAARQRQSPLRQAPPCPAIAQLCSVLWCFVVQKATDGHP